MPCHQVTLKLFWCSVLLLKVVAELPGCLNDIQHRLSPAFEIQRAAAVSEMDIVGDVVVAAVVATRWLLCAIHELALNFATQVRIKTYVC